MNQLRLTSLRYIYPEAIKTIETWFGADAERLIAEAQWSELMEAFHFEYRKPFASPEDTDTVTYFVGRHGDITFL